MQVQVHTDNKIQGGESLAQWVQQEAVSPASKFSCPTWTQANPAPTTSAAAWRRAPQGASPWA